MASSLSPEQVLAYVQHIGLPTKYHPPNQPTPSLAFLTALHIHTISTIPYENLSLHYSPTKKITIDPHHTFKKIVTDARGRGGYCMETSILFNHVLRGLGFAAYTAGVRIRLRTDGVPQGPYTGWVHLVNIVTLPGCDTRYMLDVGFGGDGPTAPIPLLPGNVSGNIEPQENRLVWEFIPEQVHRVPGQEQWVYQYRNGGEGAWNSFYAFPGVEFTEADFRVMNWYTGSYGESFQTYTVLVVKFLRRRSGVGGRGGGEGGGKGDGEGEEQEIYGKRMLVGGVVKENTGGKTRVVQECGTEEERVEALERWFGMRLSEEERRGIVGHVTELRG